MSGDRTFILVVWIVFWAGWLISALTAKKGPRAGMRRGVGMRLVVVLLALSLRGVFRESRFDIHNTPPEVVGTVVFLLGLALAVWARVYLGRNWGMPMTRKDEPELVTSGPYRFVRHPIYSGILLGVVGTALATYLYWLIALIVMGVYFVYSARIEEGIMTSTFPSTYPGYRARTKMLIPFVL
jgi:protein-S-isoprenylcysteine O-methyltransferase Ste14